MQKPHRERAQPADRAHLGFLEKKKDYISRAKHHQEKQKQLKALKRKAKFRNPNEFYFGMIGKSVENGVHWEDNPDDVKMTLEQRKLQEFNDINYLRMIVIQEKRQIKKLQSEVDRLTAVPKPKLHVLFDCSDDENEKFMEEDTTTVLKNEMGAKVEKMKEELELRKRKYKDVKRRLEEVETQQILAKDKNSAGRSLVAKPTEDHPAIYKWTSVRNK